MPSCPSKFSIQRQNVFSDTLTNLICFERAIFFNLFCAQLNELLLCCINTSNRLIVSHKCVTKNFISVNDLNFYIKCQVPKHYIKSFNILIEILDRLNQIAVKCKALRKERVFYYIYIFTVLNIFNHNVIHLAIIYFQLRITSHILLNQKINLKKSFIFEINSVSYGNKCNSDMEVDENLKEINSNNHDLSCSNKLNDLKSSKPVNTKNDDNYQSVIKDSQIINGSNYTQSSSNCLEANSTDIKIKEEIEECSSISVVHNGNMGLNYNHNYNDLTSIKSFDLEALQTDQKLNVEFLKEEPVKLNDEKIVEINIKEKDSKEIICEEKIKSEDTLKSFDYNIDREKQKDKNQCLNNTSTNYVSSSSTASKKHLQSKSQISSSNSCHKHKDSKSEKHKCSSSSSSTLSRNHEISSSSRKNDDSSKSNSKSKSKSCHHKPEEKCHCASRHHSHRHSKSKKLQSVKIQCTADEIAFELKQNKIDSTNPYFTRIPWVPHSQLTNLKYGRYYRIETDRNGGATVCHLYMDEISHLSETQLKECAIEFIKLSYSEDENDCAHHVMGIVHGAASYLPDLVDYMADHYPTLIVKTGSLASRDNHTTTMSQYRDEVYKTYSNGTFRYAPLDQLSICGVLGEEVGAYFPDFVARLEQSPFMKPVMPWSFLSVVQTDNPRESNDGPIFWVRPGEQMLPANEALKESGRPKKRRNNELDNLAYIGGSRFSEARESLFMDRTKAHADQVGVDYGLSNTAPTAAVGVLKAVNCGHPEHGNRATKDVIAFHAQDYNELLEILMLDLYEPPQTQCTKWIEVSKLNTLRREGIRYAHIQLHDNDVYYLPRKIIHQFQTISSVASVAWHIRYKDYFSVHGAPNLHTPTGINKGQVFYEKKNVALYCPPICENDLLAAVTSVESGLKTPKKSDRLKEYSPFKHSPRKMHKHQSPRSNFKKEKQSEVVPTFQTNTVNKTESESCIIPSEEKKNSDFPKKPDLSKSLDDKIPILDRDSKLVLEEECQKSSKFESPHCRQFSRDYTPVKKEQKSQDNLSSHRKEVKNLESEFSSKKDKSKQDKSPKPKSENRRSENSKHDYYAKDKRHDSSKSRKSSGSSSSSSNSSNSKHGKSENKREKIKEHNISSSNNRNFHKSKTEEEKKEESSGVKRKREKSLGRSPVKKLKETDFGLIMENGRSSSRESIDISENQLIKRQSISEERKDILDFKRTDKEISILKNVEELAEGKKIIPNYREETTSNSQFVNNNEQNFQSDTNIGIQNFDLRQPQCSGINNEILPCLSSPFPLPPPLPLNAPQQINPFVLHSPKQESASENLQWDSRSFAPQKDSLTNCVTSTLKEKTDDYVKKVKKKTSKKKNESYDLLGDIMSKMDKKK